MNKADMCKQNVLLNLGILSQQHRMLIKMPFVEVLSSCQKCHSGPSQQDLNLWFSVAIELPVNSPVAKSLIFDDVRLFQQVGTFLAKSYTFNMNYNCLSQCPGRRLFCHTLSQLM